MGMQDRNEFRRLDRARKIKFLKAEAALRGEFFDDDHWNNVYDFEYAPIVTDFELLEEDGIPMPRAETLSTTHLHKKLWDIINALASKHIFISSTDHLSDSELYTVLTQDVLHEMRRDVMLDGNATYEYDLVGTDSEEDIFYFLRYYANDRERLIWADEFAELPDRVSPPYDRDRFLPGARQSPE